MIVRARTLVTMDGPPIPNGAVAITGDTITEVGRWPEMRARATGEVIDLGERILLPGLINAHCHLDYTGLRGAIPAEASFTGWIKAINARKAELSPDDYVRSIEAGAEEAASFGTTTLANFTAFPELVGRVVEPALRIWWFAEMIDLRGPVDVRETLGKLEREVGARGRAGLAPHAPFTASAELYAATAKLAVERNVPASTHLAESVEEMTMFRDGRGPLFDFLRSLNRSVEDCGARTPLALLLGMGVFDERWIVAHLNELLADDFALLERGPRFHVAHCPRSHAYFRHSPFALRRLRGLGFNLCLGTDSLASNGDLSLFAEVRQLWKTEQSLRADEILEMVTINPAAALAQAGRLGRIRADFQADVIAIAGSVSGRAEEIIEFAENVPFAMIAGEILKSRKT
ncbi:MAG: amidohydrolase family protein [Chthoniobacterales bacterium]